MNTQDFLNSIENKELREKCFDLFGYVCSKKGFLEKPAAKHMHHAYKGGLEKHTSEVIDLALKINKLVESPFSEDNIILVGFLHDLGKLYVYRFRFDEDGTDGIDALKTSISQEALVLRLAYKFKIKPSIEVISAIEFAHGGWSNLAHNKYIEPTPLSAIIHSADLLSSKFVKQKEEFITCRDNHYIAALADEDKIIIAHRHRSSTTKPDNDDLHFDQRNALIFLDGLKKAVKGEKVKDECYTPKGQVSISVKQDEIQITPREEKWIGLTKEKTKALIKQIENLRQKARQKQIKQNTLGEGS